MCWLGGGESQQMLSFLSFLYTDDISEIKNIYKFSLPIQLPY